MARTNNFDDEFLNRVLSDALSEIPQRSLRDLYDERVKDTGLSPTRVRSMLGLDLKALEGILTGTTERPDAMKLLALATFLGINISDVMKLFLSELKADEFRRVDDLNRVVFLMEHFDLVQLKKEGIIADVEDAVQAEKRLCQFLGISSITEYGDDFPAVAFSRTKRSFSNKMLDLWTISAHTHFLEVNNPNPYDRNTFKDLVSMIRPYTKDEKNGLVTVARAMYQHGVTVIYQRALPNTSIRGATFLVNGKPCIALTGYMQNYAAVWFALLHEIYHVLFDVGRDQFVGYHLSGEADLLQLDEHKANKFAADYLLSDDRFKLVRPFIHKEMLVRQVADEAQVHPAIIYGQFQHRMNAQGSDYWSAFKHQMPPVEPTLAKLNLCHWDGESIKKNASTIKAFLEGAIVT